jgi:hypothetical protein
MQVQLFYRFQRQIALLNPGSGEQESFRGNLLPGGCTSGSCESVREVGRVNRRESANLS